MLRALNRIKWIPLIHSHPVALKHMRRAKSQSTQQPCLTSPGSRQTPEKKSLARACEQRNRPHLFQVTRNGIQSTEFGGLTGGCGRGGLNLPSGFVPISGISL